MNTCTACHRPLSVTTQVCSNCGQKRIPSTVHPAITFQAPQRPRPRREQVLASNMEFSPVPQRSPTDAPLFPRQPSERAQKQSSWSKTAFANSPTEVDIPAQGPTKSVQEALTSSTSLTTPIPLEAAAIVLPGLKPENPGDATSAFEMIKETSIEPKKRQPRNKDETNSLETFQRNPERFYATKRAAEHWRSSWIDRQRLEAGPATNVSRGQALVDEPLNIIQQSLLRIRAIVLQQDEMKQKSRDIQYWLQVIIMSVTILALTGFIVASYF